MAVENIRHVPIAAADQELLGPVSQHDLICAMYSFVDVSLDQSLKSEAAQVALEQIMLTEACTTPPRLEPQTGSTGAARPLAGLSAGDR